MHGQDDDAKDNDHADNKPLTGDEKTMEEGPAGKRHCTDCLCIILLGCCWVSMTAVGFAVIGWYDSPDLPKGNPYRLTNAVDGKGRLCGFGEGVTDKWYGYYLMSGEAVCVKKCPDATDYTDFVCRDYGDDNPQDVMDGLASDDSVGQSAYIVAGYAYLATSDCMVKLDSTAYLGYCIADIAAAAMSEAASAAASEAGSTVGNLTMSTGSGDDDDNLWDAFCADLFAAAGYIFGFGFGVALVCSFVYIWLMRLPGVLSLIIWGLLAAVQFCFLAIAGLAYSTYATWEDEATDTNADGSDNTDTVARDQIQIDMMLYLSYFLFAVAALWFCVVFCCLRKRIMLAIAVVKEAGKAISAQKLIVLFPIIQLSGVAVFMAPWTIYALYLASSGEIVTYTSSYTDPTTGLTAEAEYKQYSYSDNQRYAGLYLLFSYFWTSEFVVAIGQLVVALAISTWYFTRERDSKIGNTNVIWSIKTAFRYHAGSCAFGALIIAIIKTIRAVIAYLQKKAKKSGNKLAMLVLCIIQCCMWCVEKTMKFINKNAYIQIAIFGYSFCKAARRAFFLIARNILRIAAVSIVSSFVLLIGKILVPVGTTMLCYLALLGPVAEGTISGLWAPLFFVFILAFFTVQMFNEVFGMAIWTILQCYVADEEMFGKSGHMFVPGALASCISTTQKKAMEAAGAKVAPGDDAPPPSAASGPEELP